MAKGNNGANSTNAGTKLSFEPGGKLLTGVTPERFGQGILGDLQTSYLRGPTEQYQKSLYTGLGADTQAALSGMSNAAAANSGILGQAASANAGILSGAGQPSVTEQNLLPVAQGSYLGGANPYLDEMTKKATDAAYLNTVSAFGDQGAINDWQVQALGRATADANNQLRYGDYENERARQMQAAGMIDQARQQGIANQFGAIDRSGNLYGQTLLPYQTQVQVGQMRDADALAQRQADYELFNRTSDPNAAHMAKYLAMGGAQSALPQPEKQPGLFDWLGLGVGALGAVSPLLFSDENLKENKRKVGKTNDGTDIYTYNYKSDPNKTTVMGVMAQDVKKKNPNAAHLMDNGFLAVDYRKVS